MSGSLSVNSTTVHYELSTDPNMRGKLYRFMQKIRIHANPIKQSNWCCSCGSYEEDIVELFIHYDGSTGGIVFACPGECETTIKILIALGFVMHRWDFVGVEDDD